MIRTFSSAEEEEKKEKETEMSTGFGFTAPPVKISKKLGSHRIRWDLRHQGRTTQSGRKIPGPMVSPGHYKINFQIENQTITTTFQVLKDPRIDMQKTDFLDQEALALNVMQLQKDVDLLNHEVGKKMKSFSDASVPPELQSVHNALNTAEGRYQVPKLVDQLRYLYSMLNRADQKPGKDAFDRYKVLKSAWHDLQSEAKKAGVDWY